MRTGERDLLLTILAASAGSADGWSYFGIGHAFVANMTGNTVLLGVDVFGRVSDILHPAIAVGCYAAGVIFASVLTRKLREGDPWPRTVSATLLAESILMIGIEIAWIAFLGHPPRNYHFAIPMRDLLLGSVAFAIGMQSGAMLQLKIPGVVTTYITGTWTSLMNGLVHFASGRRRTADRQKVALEERLLLQAAILAVYLLSAMLTGWLLETFPAAVGAVPACAVLVVVVLGLVHGGGAAT
jgi:uncharacterized membrane protein YoaK (UPF0700 family)